MTSRSAQVVGAAEDVVDLRQVASQRASVDRVRALLAGALDRRCVAKSPS
jgi:hypothetical protein